MNRTRADRHKTRNRLQSGLLIAGISLLLALSSRLLFGPDLWLWPLAAIAFFMLALPAMSPYWLLRMYNARPLERRQAPGIIGLLEELAHRAGLARVPRLYWVPSRSMNAFAVGSQDEAAIAVTEGLLQALPGRELAGVLAHELSHIRNNDLRIMTLADLMTRLSHSLSSAALLVLFLMAPFVLIGDVEISLTGLLILMLSPALSALLQFGLSRVREFDADLDAARLTGDPAGLAAALARIDIQSGSPWRRILSGANNDPQPSILRTHPPSRERIERLLTLSDDRAGASRSMTGFYTQEWRQPWEHVVIRAPRRHYISGIWR